MCIKYPKYLQYICYIPFFFMTIQSIIDISYIFSYFLGNDVDELLLMTPKVIVKKFKYIKVNL